MKLAIWSALLCGAVCRSAHPSPAVTPGRFEARGDVVYDRKTSLLWQRCSAGQIWRDGHCTGRAMIYLWDEATRLGSNGWRLPGGQELRSLVDQDRKARKLSPYIDVNAFPDMPMLVDGQNRPAGRFFWSSTPRPSCIDSTRMGCADYVEFDSDLGDDGWMTMSKSKRFFVRLVRPGAPTVPQTLAVQSETSKVSADGRFVLTGNEAYDRKTGLTWQRCDAGRPISTEGFGCLGVHRPYMINEALHLGGNGWHLPTRDELETLLDHHPQKQWPQIGHSVFLDVDPNAVTYWTSTPYPDFRHRQWYCVNFDLLRPSNCGDDSPRSARLVRKGP